MEVMALLVNSVMRLVVRMEMEVHLGALPAMVGLAAVVERVAVELVEFRSVS